MSDLEFAIQTPDDEREVFWETPEEAGNIIGLYVFDGKLHAECERGLFEILPDGTHVGIVLA